MNKRCGCFNNVLSLRWVHFLLCISFVFCIYGQTGSGNQPSWTNGKDLPRSKSFYYFLGIGYSQYRDTARLIAIRSAIREYAESHEMSFVLSTQTKQEENEIIKDRHSQIISNYQVKVNVKGIEKTITIRCFEIAAFYEQPGGHYYVLIRIPRTSEIDCGTSIHVNNGAALWRSALIPGWGQLYKKQKLKGWSFLVLESTAVALSIFSHYQYNSNYDYANTITNPVIRNSYIDTAENWANVRTISVISAGVIYVINIFDAILTKGEPRFASGPAIFYPSLFQNHPVMTFAFKIDY